MRLDGKVALVTGAVGGIGTAIVEVFLAEGAAVILCDKKLDEVAARVTTLRAGGARVFAAAADITDHAALCTSVSAAMAQAGEVDIVIANASTGNRSDTLRGMTPATWREDIADNMAGQFNTVDCVLEPMKRRRAGSIVLIGSVNGPGDVRASFLQRGKGRFDQLYQVDGRGVRPVRDPCQHHLSRYGTHPGLGPPHRAQPGHHGRSAEMVPAGPGRRSRGCGTRGLLPCLRRGRVHLRRSAARGWRADGGKPDHGRRIDAGPDLGVKPLSFAVLGSGAMGSFAGGCLSAAGAGVTLLDVDDGHIAAINQSGLRITTDAADRVVHPSAMRPEELREAPDVVIVLTKQPNTRAALAAIAPVLASGCWVLTLQNGLGNQEIIEEFVPRERILLGVTTYPADLLGPGHVGSHGEGEINLMTADGVDRPIAHQLAEALAASGQKAIVDPQLAVAIWSKVAFNCAMNGICAVTGCRVGQLGANPAARSLALQIASEVVAVAQKAGIPLDDSKVRATVEHAMDTQLAHKPSMLQDMLAGRPTEIASINGAVIAVAARLGQEVPLTSALYALVRLAEQRN